MNNKFAAFILTNGRADNVKTYGLLRKSGYTGAIYILIDNEDKDLPRYVEKYGDIVLVFDKKDVANRYDEGDNFQVRQSIFYARNACFEIAKNMGLKWFVQLDDDYTDICFRFNNQRRYIRSKKVESLDDTISAIIIFLERTSVDCLAFAQGGDFIGGSDAWFLDAIKIKRKAMNSLFCRTDRKFDFIGKINEDVNTYVLLGSVGKLFFTINTVSLEQLRTQSNKGGMTGLYISSGTYAKSFYSIMYMPSAVKIALMGNKEKRIHHKINWNYCVPKILRQTNEK